MGFPELPGVGQPATPHLAYRVSYGSEFATRGIVSLSPPEVGPAYPILVPSVDADGNELGGLKMPEVAVPLATYTGWNLFRPRETDLPMCCPACRAPTSHFPRTVTERRATGDSRPSIEERYHGRSDYLGQVSAAGLRLIEDGYLLSADLAQILTRAEQHWDYLLASSEAASSGN